jgi:nucleoside 2-deoxyribosyltransferase
MKNAWDQGFEPALKSTGYDPVRVDLEEFNGKIDDFIVAQIRRSELMVADFTGQRGGVYFEAGFAKGLGIEVIFTCKNADIPNLHLN